jgi:hypothetical protein
MTRRVVEHHATNLDREQLVVITVYEESANKEQVKKESRLSKWHGVLIQRGKCFEFK